MDTFPPHDGSVRLFLRTTAPDDVALARQVLRPARNAGRHPQEALYHRGHGGTVDDAATRADFDQGLDPSPGQALDEAAPPDLRERDCGCHSLLVAGQGRREQT